jgi:hypothetical protein
MSMRILASVAFTILGCVALYSAVLMLQGLLSIPAYMEEYQGNLLIIVVAIAFPLVLMVTGGLALILQRDRLATSVVGEADEGVGEIDSAQIPELAFALLGLYLVITTLPSLGSLAVSAIDYRGWEDTAQFEHVFRSNLGHYAGTLAQFVAGGCLFLYARSLGSWWRRRGVKKAEKPVAPPTICPACGGAFDPTDYRASIEEKRCSQCGELLPDKLFG